MFEKINKLFGTKFKDSDNNSFVWKAISIHLNLPESIIREFKDYVNWISISRYQILSESFIREFKNKVDWEFISVYQTLSEDFIREFRNKVSWVRISEFQILSESFIEEFKDEVNWWGISKFQILSWDFILKSKDRVIWSTISSYQPFIDSSYEKIIKKSLEQNKLYQLYQQTKNRGWFVGYINSEFRKNYLNIITEEYKSTVKSQIYWKNLKLTNRINKFEPIRRVKYV